MAFTIRLMTAGDIPEVMGLLRIMGEENSPLPVDYAKVQRHAEGSIADGTAFVAEKIGKNGKGKVVACCALFESEVWYSNIKCLSDYFFFVHPRHRTYRLSKRMLDAAKRAADVVNLPLVMGVMVTNEPLRKFKFFERQMTPLGGFFIYGHDKVKTDVLRAEAA